MKTQKTAKAPDRRVQRTRRILRGALIELILERGFDGLTVQDVCARADIGRSTFYTHFADLEDLLVSGFDELRHVLRAPQPQENTSPSTPLAFSRRLIEHTRENHRLFRAMVGKRGGHIVQKRFRKMLIEMIEEDMAQSFAPGPRREAAVHYIAGAFFELVTWWHDTRTSLTSESLDELLHQLSQPVFAALRELE